MSFSKKLKALELIHRIQRFSLDSSISELEQSNHKKAVIDQAISELEEKRIHETHIDLPEAIPYLAHFLQTVKTERMQLDAANRLVDEEIEVRKAVVIEKWIEARKIGVVKDATRTLSKKSLTDKEQGDLDERQVILHRRN